MSATFDPALTTARDRMRFDLGDTNVSATKAAGADPLQIPVDDAVYDGVLARRGGDERLSTIDMADALVNRYAQEPSKADLPSGEAAEWANRLGGWRALSSRLRGEIEASAATTAPRGMAVLRPHRPGREPGGEHHAGGRDPLDRGY